MELFRIFPWDGRSRGGAPGGPFFVPRHKQGAGRHDVPEKDGVIYTSKIAVSAVAEALKSFRGQPAPPGVFDRPDGTRLALATFDLHNAVVLVDLDDPTELAARGLNPSLVASGLRPATQALARTLYDEGVAAFLWWSALNASWKNAALFEGRVRSGLRVTEITALRAGLDVVTRAALELNVSLK
ncbi:MAG: RES family NAD+ phosphorylase [Deltaproteobacteria bacterium]|nr:RES family NAD+ phosphorylase [Deltaproteobacteria bacterium]